VGVTHSLLKKIIRGLERGLGLLDNGSSKLLGNNGRTNSCEKCSEKWD
jgi:hypothetical protein